MTLIVRERHFDTFPPEEGEGAPVLAAATVRAPSLLHALAGTDARMKRRTAYCGRAVPVGFRLDRTEVDAPYVLFHAAAADEGGLALPGEALRGAGGRRVGSVCGACEQLAPKPDVMARFDAADIELRREAAR